MGERKGLSRREFLRLGALAGTGTLVAACAPQVVEKEVTKEVVKEVTVGPEEMPKVYHWPSISLLRPEGSDPEKYTAVQEYIMSEIGIKPISSVPPHGAAQEEKLNLLLGSKKRRMDVFNGDWPQYKDIIIPLNDLLDEYGQNIIEALKVSGYEDPMINWNGMKDAKGNIWGINRLGLMGHTAYTWFRTDWLEDLGLDMPSTVEEMEEAMTAFKEAHPKAVIGSRSIYSARRDLVGGWTEHGDSRWFDEDEGRIKPPELQPGFKDWLAKMNEWWEKGWWHPEAFTTFDMEEALKTDHIGIWAGWYSRITIDATRVIEEGAVSGMEYGFPDVLKGPKGHVRTNNASMTAAYMIPKDCPNPEAVIRYMNWQYDPIKDNVVTCHTGLKGVDWEWVDPDKKYYVRRLVTKEEPMYAGEFYLGAGLGPETWYAFEDPLWGPHYEHIHNYAFQYENAKMPVDVDVPYDMGAIRDKVPGLEDIDRLREEEEVKFITGRRSINEFDDFIQQLYKAGLEDWMEAYTEQYLKYHPA